MQMRPFSRHERCKHKTPEQRYPSSELANTLHADPCFLRSTLLTVTDAKQGPMFASGGGNNIHAGWPSCCFWNSSAQECRAGTRTMTCANGV